MKKHLFLLLGMFLSVTLLSAQEPGNYKPNNRNVKLTETSLPIVIIDINNQKIDRDNRVTGEMKIIFNGEGVKNYTDLVAHPDQKFDYSGKIGLKYRGNTSFTHSPKKPYAIRTQDEKGAKQKVSILGMSEDDDWVLLAPYADKTMIRDVLIYTLSKNNFEFTPTLKYCELILDGTYYGVYIIGERVRRGDGRLDLKKTGTSDDALTGGYQLEVDRDDEPVYTSKYSPEKSDGTKITNRKISYQYKYPELGDMVGEAAVQQSFITKRIDDFERSFTTPNYTDPLEGYRKYVDVESFINYMISTELSKNTDGYRLSTNLYKHRDSMDGGKFKMALWDFNISFGNADYGKGWETEGYAYKYNDHSSGDTWLVPFWWNRMMKDPQYVAQLKQTWTAYRESCISDSRINAVVDSLSGLLTSSGAADRNYTAWPFNVYIWPNYFWGKTYQEDLNYLKNFIADRVLYLDSRWNQKSLFDLEARYSIKNIDTQEYFTVNANNAPESSPKKSDYENGWIIQQLEDGTYSMANAKCGLLIDRGKEDNGLNLLSLTALSGTPKTSQSWIFELKRSGYYKIVSNLDGKVMRNRKTDGILQSYTNSNDGNDKMWAIEKLEFEMGLDNQKVSTIKCIVDKGSVTVQQIPSDARISLINLQGMVLDSKTASAHSDARFEAPGSSFYLVHVASSNGTSVRKIYIPE